MDLLLLLSVGLQLIYQQRQLFFAFSVKIYLMAWYEMKEEEEEPNECGHTRPTLFMTLFMIFFMTLVECVCPSTMS